MGPLFYLARIRRDEGRLEEARALCEEALACVRHVGDKGRTLACLHDLGLILLLQGELAPARARLTESLALCRELDMQGSMMNAIFALGQVARREGKWEEARARYTEALRSARASERGSRSVAVMARFVDGLGVLAQETGDWLGAARLLGAAEALRSQGSDERPGFEREDSAVAVAGVRAALGEDTFTAAWAEGRVISLEQAVEYALPETPTNAFKDDDPAHTPGARSSSSSRQQRSKTACAKTET